MWKHSADNNVKITVVKSGYIVDVFQTTAQKVCKNGKFITDDDTYVRQAQRDFETASFGSDKNLKNSFSSLSAK